MTTARPLRLQLQRLLKQGQDWNRVMRRASAELHSACWSLPQVCCSCIAFWAFVLGPRTPHDIGEILPRHVTQRSGRMQDLTSAVCVELNSTTTALIVSASQAPCCVAVPATCTTTLSRPNEHKELRPWPCKRRIKHLRRAQTQCTGLHCVREKIRAAIGKKPLQRWPTAGVQEN